MLVEQVFSASYHGKITVYVYKEYCHVVERLVFSLDRVMFHITKISQYDWVVSYGKHIHVNY
jgi:hypothetical protein